MKKINFVFVLVFAGVINAQEFNITNERSDYYTYDKFAGEIYFSPKTRQIVKKINLASSIVEETEFPTLPVFFHHSHKAIYLEITDSSNIYWEYNYDSDSTRLIFEYLYPKWTFQPFHTISPNDSLLEVGGIRYISDGTAIPSRPDWIVYGEGYPMVWSSDSTVIFKSLENALAEYYVHSTRIDTLVTADEEIISFDYNRNLDLLAYSTGRGFNNEKLFIYDKLNQSFKFLFNPVEDDPDYCGAMWTEFDDLSWNQQTNNLVFFGYVYINPNAPIYLYQPDINKVIYVTDCSHFGLKRNVTWISGDTISYVRPDWSRIYGYDISTAITDVKSENQKLLYHLTVSNYPNPFNNFTQIEYSLSLQGMVSFEIFNSIGQAILKGNLGYHVPGSYRFTWDSKNSAENNLSSGIYFLRLSLKGKHMQFHKIIKIVYQK